VESGDQFYVGAFDRNLASVTMKLFSHLIYFVKKFYNFFSAICKDDAAISCITIQHKKSSFPSTLIGHVTLVLK
jgi:hypothetical protein